MLSRHALRLAALLSVLATPASADCARSDLLAAAQAYIAAQAHGTIAALPLSATGFSYRQNNRRADIASGSSILTRALPIDLNRTTTDPVACASYTLLISASGPSPYVISTQLRHSPSPPSSPSSSSAELPISSIDSIVATTGALFFNATRTLSYIRAENWGPLPDSGGGVPQANRSELLRIADAYLDMWTDAAAADAIPWGADCERVEGSALTRPCGAALPRGGAAVRNGDRRYVVDEDLGSAQVLCSFDALGSLPDSHEIRVEDGKVKYVHTVTVLN
ncbi:putative gar1-domain-containing protein [Rosellinia necatrix]|uniref:Putative gar1-domain-containing protein n=1 Tax=Rosellinia necatrix TaxID=77044 RepID=A0A1W2TJ32_ROSNE|nr:putative gar1-domain-containing protein [Rosellinia necatrix]